MAKTETPAANPPQFFNPHSTEVYVAAPSSALVCVSPYLAPGDPKRRPDRTYIVEGEWYERHVMKRGGPLQPFRVDGTTTAPFPASHGGKAPPTPHGMVPSPSVAPAPAAEAPVAGISQSADAQAPLQADAGPAQADPDSNPDNSSQVTPPSIKFGNEADSTTGNWFTADVTHGGAVIKHLKAKTYPQLHKLLQEFQATPEWQTIPGNVQVLAATSVTAAKDVPETETEDASIAATAIEGTDADAENEPVPSKGKMRLNKAKK